MISITENREGGRTVGSGTTMLVLVSVMTQEEISIVFMILKQET